MPASDLLLIDDDPAHRLLAARALRRAFPDLIIHEAAGLAEAKAILRMGCGLAVIDYNLGSMTAPEIVTMLRQDPRHKQRIPILVYSTSQLLMDAEASYRAGADAFLYKTENAGEFSANLSAAIRFLRRAAG